MESRQSGNETFAVLEKTVSSYKVGAVLPEDEIEI